MLHDQAYRYNRQMFPNRWGKAEQKRIEESSVFIAGAGGLGNSVAVYLTAVGVGCLRICDSARIDLSNLNRQILYTESNIGQPKVECMKDRLAQLNQYVRIIPLNGFIKPDSVAELVGDAEIIVDCLDNYQSRMILNNYSVRNQKPLVHAGVQEMFGQLIFIHPPATPCLGCIYPVIEERTDKYIMGAAAGVIGSLQALEVIKFITGIGSLMMNRILVWDGERMTFSEIPVARRKDCHSCSGLS
jgi:adenylyltransferase/sulfurtransferase